MRGRNSWGLLLGLGLMLVGCVGPTRAVPMPGVHVYLEFAPDPSMPGHCCKATLINPTKKGVYVRCTMVAYRPDGGIAFEGSLSGGPAGWYAPPGQTVLAGRKVPVSDAGKVFRWHRHWSISTHCDAFVWHGQPPI